MVVQQDLRGGPDRGRASRGVGISSTVAAPLSRSGPARASEWRDRGVPDLVRAVRAPRSRARSGSGSSACSSSNGCPAAVTRSPGFACITTPAPAETGSSLRARPAPSRQAATPTARASETGQYARWRGSWSRRAASRATGSRGIAGSPPWAADHRPPRRPWPGRRQAPRRGSASASPAPASISRARVRVSSTTSSGPPPASTSRDSRDLERITRGASERGGHVGEQGDRPDAVRAAEFDHRPGQFGAPASAVLHERAGADLDVEHQRRGPLGDLLAHDRTTRSAGSTRRCR